MGTTYAGPSEDALQSLLDREAAVFEEAGIEQAQRLCCSSRLLDAKEVAPLIAAALECATVKDPDAGKVFGRGMRGQSAGRGAQLPMVALPGGSRMTVVTRGTNDSDDAGHATEEVTSPAKQRGATSKRRHEETRVEVDLATRQLSCGPSTHFKKQFLA
jgi:hypothetical protein